MPSAVSKDIEAPDELRDTGTKQIAHLVSQVFQLRGQDSLLVRQPTRRSLEVTLGGSRILVQQVQASQSKILLGKLLNSLLACFSQRLQLDTGDTQVCPVLANRLDLTDKARAQVLENLI